MARTRHFRQPHTALIALRIDHGLSRDDLWRRSGVSRETIRLAEEWGHVPTARVQFALAQAFGKTPLEIWPMERQRVCQRV